MRYKFIPVNNSLNKAVAFANSLDNKFITNVQKIKQKEFYIPTLDVVNKLQKEGWEIHGVDEKRGKSRKIDFNYIQMRHPDFSVKNNKGKNEALASLTIENSCSGTKPLKMDLGMYREVCSNGLITFDRMATGNKINHTKSNNEELDKIIYNLTSKSNKVIEEVISMKKKDMSFDQIKKLAYNASKLRFKENEEGFNLNEILKVNRSEDEGNDVWTVFNRIQENLTHDVINKQEDIRINQMLYDLVNQEMEVV